MRKRLLWQIFPPMALVVIGAVLAITWFATTSLRDFYLQQTKADLQIRAALIRAQVLPLLAKRDFTALKAFGRESGVQAAARLTVILPAGAVAADSIEDPARMDNHADRPEVIEALAGRVGSARRFSNTLRKNMLYVAVPLGGPGAQAAAGAEIIGVLRLSIPTTVIETRLGQVYARIVLTALALIIIAAIVTLSISRKISRPLEVMRNTADRFAQGQLDRKLNIEREGKVSSEMADLAAALNRMAGQLQERLGILTGQRNELEAVFAGMVEAVLVIDTDERFINVNKSAVDLLGLKSSEIKGKHVLEVIRNPDLRRFVTDTLASRGSIEEELVLHAEQGLTHLQAHGTLLADEHGRSFGGLIVFNDVTRLRKLEEIRRDFVANVSHELKTPITTIKGFVETLRDGALDHREDAIRFLDIVLKHADRLNAIVEDLLTLSRIEEEDERAEIVLRREPVDKTLRAAIETCTVKADDKKIKTRLRCTAGLTADINAPLLEQAVINLIVNAIKYSDEGSEIIVQASRREDYIAIRVQDFGVGIAREHLPRLFERFYRSDKARSRKLGGTGLGLAIVKHIAQAHDGRVSVDSAPGKGSTFTILLPAPT